MATCESNNHLYGRFGLCLFCKEPKPPMLPTGDLAEDAFWRFDARRKGYGEWQGMPMSERDAFKAEFRNQERTARVVASSPTPGGGT